MTSKVSAILAVAVLALSVEAATAQPRVAMVPIDLPAQADVRVAVPTLNEVVGNFAVSSVNDAADTITLDSAGFSSGQFPMTNGVPLYYVRFTSGALAGRWYDITSQDGSNPDKLVLAVENTGNSPDLNSASVGDNVRVIKHWTMSDLFPDGDEGLSFQGSPNSFNIKFSVFIPRDSDAEGINQAVQTRVFYNSSAKQWQFTDTSNADEVVIYPQGTLLIRNEGDANTTAPQTAGTVVDETTDNVTLFARGLVQAGPVVELIPASSSLNDVILGAANVFPVKLADSGLDGVVAVSPNSFTITDSLFLSQLPVPENAGFNLASPSRFIFDGSEFVTLANEPAGDEEIKPGQVLILREQAGAAEAWTVKN